MFPTNRKTLLVVLRNPHVKIGIRDSAFISVFARQGLVPTSKGLFLREAIHGHVLGLTGFSGAGGRDMKHFWFEGSPCISLGPVTVRSQSVILDVVVAGATAGEVVHPAFHMQRKLQTSQALRCFDYCKAEYINSITLRPMDLFENPTLQGAQTSRRSAPQEGP